MTVNMDHIIYAATRITTEQLTDIELNVHYLCLLFDGNPKHKLGYDKASPLYTEQDGARMHTATRSAFERIVFERLGFQEPTL